MTLSILSWAFLSSWLCCLVWIFYSGLTLDFVWSALNPRFYFSWILDCCLSTPNIFACSFYNKGRCALNSLAISKLLIKYFDLVLALIFYLKLLILLQIPVKLSVYLKQWFQSWNKLYKHVFDWLLVCC
jgi:hypothetical protein